MVNEVDVHIVQFRNRYKESVKTGQNHFQATQEAASVNLHQKFTMMKRLSKFTQFRVQGKI